MGVRATTLQAAGIGHFDIKAQSDWDNTKKTCLMRNFSDSCKFSDIGNCVTAGCRRQVLDPLIELVTITQADLEDAAGLETILSSETSESESSESGSSSVQDSFSESVSFDSSSGESSGSDSKVKCGGTLASAGDVDVHSRIKSLFTRKGGN